MQDFAVTPSALESAPSVRHSARPTGVIRPGSDAHLQLFCLEPLETHDPYRPAIMEWPVLPDDVLERIKGLPIWDIAVETEGKAGINVRTFGEQLPAGILRDAVLMDAFEESRHKEVLSHLVRFYGIELQPEPAYLPPADPEWAFLRTGYSECIDSSEDLGLKLSLRELAEVCLREYDRCPAPYDSRLIRPNFVPRMVRFALRLIGRPPAGSEGAACPDRIRPRAAPCGP